MKALLIALAAAFLAQLVAGGWFSFSWDAAFALSPTLQFETLWQVLTYPFVQDGLGFLISAVFLWLAMAPLEAAFGTPKTIQFLFVVTLAAAAPVLIVGLLGQGTDAAVVQFGPVVLSPLYSVNPHIAAAIMAYAWPLRHSGPLRLFGVVSLTVRQLLGVLILMSALPLLAGRNITHLLANLGAIGAALMFIRPASSRGAKKPKRKNDAGLRLIKDDEPPKYLN